MLKYLFRKEFDNVGFQLFSPIHISVIVVLIISLYFLQKYQDNKKTKNIIDFLIIILFIDRALMYYWYYLSDNFILKETLPLYTCRASIYILLAYLVTKKSYLKNIFIYWANIGAIIAIIYPNPYDFKFPHYTFISFFVFHYILIIVSSYYILKKKDGFSTKSFIKVMISTNIFLVFVRFLNHILDANYSYLVFSPILKDFFLTLNPFLYFFIVLIIYNLIFFVFHLLLQKVKK